MHGLPFDALALQPDDPLLALIGAVRSDPRQSKVDLGVGVYRDEDGRTPVLQAVKAAERILVESQTTKAYVGPAGDLEFLDRVWALVAGTAVPNDRVAGVQTVGGSGALRLAAELLRETGCGRIIVGEPTWPNHFGIFAEAGLAVEPYSFFDIDTQRLLFDRLREALSHSRAGDAALLHGSCHNPTGAVLSNDQWREISDILADRGVIPLIDLAYQGFGRGVDEDVAGLRCLLERVPEALVTVSASKTFGLYRERTGAIYAVASSAKTARAVGSNLQRIARTSYSMPPDHGAAIVRMILASASIREIWLDELETMRCRIVRLRRAVAAVLGVARSGFHRIAEQEGMFSMLPLGSAQIQHLRTAHAIYMPSSGRINIAGLKEAEVVSVMTVVAQPQMSRP